MAGARPTVTLRQRALMWLAQREHSRKELHDKLLRWVQAQEMVHALAACAPSAQADGSRRPNQPEASQIPGVLDELEAAGHLSDARVVESRLHVRTARFGNLRIERELQQLGVGPSQEVRSTLRATELERARGVWARKFGQPGATAAERAKQMRFLAGRGFSADTIRAVLTGSPEDDPAA